MHKMTWIASFILMSILSNDLMAKGFNAKDPLEIDRFDFPEPRSTDLGTKLSLWATYYLTPRLNDGQGEYPLRTKNGEILGPMLSKAQWCNVALEGSVQIVFKNQAVKTFNYAGVTSDFAVNCKEYFKFDVSKTKFMEAVGPYGDGLPEQFILEPYRTLATDNNFIKPATVLYIPSARGAKVKLPNGKVIIHDGYFFAGDKGGAIKNNHIDVFIGNDHEAPYFPWIKSSASGSFNAFIVNDPKIISELSNLHAQ